MLEYRENIGYSVSEAYSIDDELTELKELCQKGIDDFELYSQIREYIFREIKIKELAVTKILQDLMEIKKRSAKGAEIIQYFICYNDRSYSEVAADLGCSKQLIHQTVKYYADNFLWLKNLIAIKGMEDSKNENNRSIFFTGKKKVESYQQMCLFGGDGEQVLSESAENGGEGG